MFIAILNLILFGVILAFGVALYLSREEQRASRKHFDFVTAELEEQLAIAVDKNNDQDARLEEAERAKENTDATIRLVSDELRRLNRLVSATSKSKKTKSPKMTVVR